MSAFLNVKEIKEKVSLLDQLNNLGFTPQKASGGAHFFLGMLREEYTALPHVNGKLGVWFDHGGAGGLGDQERKCNRIRAGLFYPSGFPEVLHKIVEYADVSFGPLDSISSGEVMISSKSSRQVKSSGSGREMVGRNAL